MLWIVSHRQNWRFLSCSQMKHITNEYRSHGKGEARECPNWTLKHKYNKGQHPGFTVKKTNCFHFKYFFLFILTHVKGKRWDLKTFPACNWSSGAFLSQQLKGVVGKNEIKRDYCSAEVSELQVTQKELVLQKHSHQWSVSCRFLKHVHCY